MRIFLKIGIICYLEYLQAYWNSPRYIRRPYEWCKLLMVKHFRNLYIYNGRSRTATINPAAISYRFTGVCMRESICLMWRQSMHGSCARTELCYSQFWWRTSLLCFRERAGWSNILCLVLIGTKEECVWYQELHRVSDHTDSPGLANDQLANAESVLRPQPQMYSGGVAKGVNKVG